MKNKKTKTEIFDYLSIKVRPEDWRIGTESYKTIMGKQIKKKYVYVSISFLLNDFARQLKGYGFKGHQKKYNRYGILKLSPNISFPYMELKMEYEDEGNEYV